MGAFFLPLFGNGAHAQLRVNVSQGFVDPFPIALSPALGSDQEAKVLGQRIVDVVNGDLSGSGLFRSLPPESFLQAPGDLWQQPRFEDWRLIGAQAVAQVVVERDTDNRVRVRLRFWDVLSQGVLLSKSFSTENRAWRRVAHLIADDIYRRVTGEEGYFDSRIVYISESGRQDRRRKRLALMDQDGANHTFLTNDRFLVLTPRFSPSQQQIVYLRYPDEGPVQVVVRNLAAGTTEAIGKFQGMSFAPRFSPDGRHLIMSLARTGNSEIYRYNMRRRTLERLTEHPAIDTAPSYAPDSSEIAFESDRSGGQQLYVMNADGTGVRRISFGVGRYATPVWSPRGDYIAFTHTHRGRFAIGVIRPDGSGERLLATGFLVEGPTWAPNGRVLAFFRQGRAGAQGRQSSRLYSIDITGYNERALVTPGDASDPAWSPTHRSLDNR